MMSATVMRGSSEPKGSWKMYWICRRKPCRAGFVEGQHVHRAIAAVKDDAAIIRPDRAHDHLADRGLASSRSRRRLPKRLPAIHREADIVDGDHLGAPRLRASPPCGSGTPCEVQRPRAIRPFVLRRTWLPPLRQGEAASTFTSRIEVSRSPGVGVQPRYRMQQRAQIGMLGRSRTRRRFHAPLHGRDRGQRSRRRCWRPRRGRG